MATEEPAVGRFETADINDHVQRLLRDLGASEPPIRLEEVRALQSLDLTYYSKSNLNLLDEMAHRAKMAGSTLMSSARSMVEVTEKFGLRGLLMLKEHEKKIFIDKEVPDPKRRFIIAHEIIHDLLPWHRALLLGDNDQTLSPTCHQAMEAEANYGGRRLIFMGDRFQSEARDCDFDWKAIDVFKKRYGNTITTTLWQMVCERDPTQPAFGMVSRHPYYQNIGKGGADGPVRHFIQSPLFREQFANVTNSQTYEAMKSYLTTKRSGPLGEGEVVLTDKNGTDIVFFMSTFCNRYDLLTYGRALGPRSTLVKIGAVA